MKVFEHQLLTLTECTGHLHDPFQFAYQNDRSVEDAVALSLHHSLQYLEKSGPYVRMLFLDFSSAFNAIVPHKLFDQLQRGASMSIFLSATVS